jgi:predicted transcriptional regulator
MKTNKKPTQSELEVLQIIWSIGPSSVREVHRQLSTVRDVFYTTTLKTMQVMTEKGFLDRDTSQRSHIYRAKVKQADIEKKMIDSLLKTMFSGSTSRMVISAIGSQKLTHKELKEIKSLIDQMESDD